ncbi:hypothetical protein CsSME_00042221 [Camellia sinensis var. sinensis]
MLNHRLCKFAATSKSTCLSKFPFQISNEQTNIHMHQKIKRKKKIMTPIFISC